MEFAMLSFQFLVKSGKSMLTALIWRIRYASFFQTLNISATNQEIITDLIPIEFDFQSYFITLH